MSRPVPARRGRPKGSTKYAVEDAISLAKIAALLVAQPATSVADAIRQATGKSDDESLIHRLRAKWKTMAPELLTSAGACRSRNAIHLEGEGPMIDFFHQLQPMVNAAVGAAVASSIPYILPKRLRKSGQSPIMRFDFLDLVDHEDLGAPGFRHIQSKTELSVSGRIQNVGAVPLFDIKLNVYHYQSSRPQPTHEIVDIDVGDVLQPGKSFEWSKSLSQRDLTVAGIYFKSGTTGIFTENWINRYNHFHVVFSCRNVHSETSSVVYTMEKIIEDNSFKGNRMVFIKQVEKYHPRRMFPTEWRDEIKARETLLKECLLLPPVNYVLNCSQF
jgi:hypothetical protein